MIDHAYAYKQVSLKSKTLFKNLEKSSILDDFLKYVKKVDSKVYKEWIEMELIIPHQ